MSRHIQLLLFLITLLCLQTTFASQLPLKTTQLQNGMKVIVREDHRSEVAVMQVWYRVGSIDEPSGKTGMSHMLEHLMFKGTKSYPGDSFERKIAKNGGNHNAATSSDFTVYYEELKADRLAVAFELEADRMKNLQITEKDFYPEREVVQEERRLRVEDKPNALLYEQLKAIAHFSTGYHHPVIGWMDDIANLSLADMQTWYRQWYSPNNAALVVVGDVNADEIFKLADKHFGKLPANALPEERTRQGQVQQGARRFVLKRHAKLPHLLMGYRAPVYKTAVMRDEPYALFVLSAILSGGESARFAKNLVRGSGVAVYADSSYSLLGRADDLFTFSAIPSQGIVLADLEVAVRQEIINIIEQPIPAEELARVKNKIIAEEVYSRDAIASQAYSLGQLWISGLPLKLDEAFVQEINQVTAEQVQAVAKKYLVDDQLTLGMLVPERISGSKDTETQGIS